MTNPDLPLRVATATVLVIVASAALLAGPVWFGLLLMIAAIIATVEFVRLTPWMRPRTVAIALALGIAYIWMAAYSLLTLRAIGVAYALFPVIVTMATDVGAYFSGRTIGGPKIAPAISPSKTWAGLVGGMIAAAIAAALWGQISPGGETWPRLALLGAGLAIVAQIGDFGESWLKRRAGVKDSGTLLPGHGGVLDRIDGLLPVAIMSYLGYLAA